MKFQRAVRGVLRLFNKKGRNMLSLFITVKFLFIGFEQVVVSGAAAASSIERQIGCG